jgi:hypothetical protein
MMVMPLGLRPFYHPPGASYFPAFKGIADGWKNPAGPAKIPAAGIF